MWRLPEPYKRAREALQERFEPSTKKELYKIKIRSQMKKPTETWGDFADELCVLADKAYPELQEKSKGLHRVELLSTATERSSH